MDAARILKNRRGIAFVYITLALFALIGMAALAIDVGYFYVVKSQLQNAADSAALAGVSGLKGGVGINPFANETTARYRAQSFAQQNKAAGTPVLLDLNTANATTGDIVIGCWNKPADTMNTGCGRPNSIEVITRRSSDAVVDPSPVGTFFGKIFNISTVNIKATAVAQRPSKPTIPLAHCLPICPDEPTHLPLPATFHFKIPGGSDTYTLEEVMGWTEFSAISKATDLGPNSDVAKFIKQELEIPIDVCNKIVYTNTGIGSLRPILLNEYNTKKDASGIWKVILPIYTECPAVNQAAEKLNTLVRYAEAEISSLDMNASDPTITISNVTCMPCGTANFLSDTPQLVK